ncbi:MAG: LysM peptidoglycan-binding domain-containing protein [Propionibacterium sp.]|nr:LysM peptidoglycan-binding domain-containing protein [Propionibacterium sp.]
MQWLRALGSLTILVGVVVGVPWLLLTLGSPLTLLDVDWGTALLRPDDGRVVLGLLSVVGWVAWLVLTATLLAELVAVASRRRIDVRIPGTGWLRPVIGSLVAAATLTPGAIAVAAPMPDAPPVVSSVLPSAPPRAPDAALQTGRDYVVQPGDELWSVAEAQLGSGDRWRDLLTVNPGLSAAARLTPGQRVQLPPDVVVRPGDSLWALAERHLGDPERWPEIHELNTELVPDPDHLEVGWHLLLPTARAPLPVPADPPEPELAPAAAEPAESTQSTAPAPPPRIPSTPPVAPSAAPSAGAETPAASPEAAESTDAEEAGRVLGPIGGLLASTIIVSVAARRRLQLVGRAVGRRLIPLNPSITHFWTALARRAGDEAPDDAPHPPTGVLLGWTDDGSDVVHDLESARLTSMAPDGDAQALMGAILTGLLCAPWSQVVEVVVVGVDQPWADALDDPRLTSIGTVAEGVAHHTKLCARRRLNLGTALLDEVRGDPDTAPAYTPVVYLFATPLSAPQRSAVDEALGFGRVGVSVVLVGDGGAHVNFDGDHARLGGVTFEPQLVTAPARRALIDLFTWTGSTATEAAPWFTGERPAKGQRIDPDPRIDAPYLVLLGEPDLLDARGTPPPRARQQCVEYCAWMVFHPNARPTTMQMALVIAEGTRRSNLSRLRKWLGSDDEGHEYLPDAYDGRLDLDRRITTDWHVLRHLLADGVDVAPDRALRQALTMVQGPPLGSAKRRWVWARDLHDDMVSVVVDAACTLADRSLDGGHLDDALWALRQAELAAPDHDEVAIRLVTAHSLAGDHDAAEAASSKLLDQLRQDNRELTIEHAESLDEAHARLHREQLPRRLAEEPAALAF